MVRPGEIHMNESEIEDGVDGKSLQDIDMGARGSHRTGMDDLNQQSRSYHYPPIQV